MSEPVYTFDAAGMRKLVADHYKLQREVRALTTMLEHGQATFLVPGLYLAFTAHGAIPARVDADGKSTPGEGEVDIYRLDYTDGPKLKSAGYKEKVLNVFSAEIAADKWIQLKRETITARLLVDAEDCG